MLSLELYSAIADISGLALQLDDNEYRFGDAAYTAFTPLTTTFHSYDWPDPPTWSGDGNDNVSVKLVRYDVVPPEIESATTTALELGLTYDESLDADSEPAPSAFTVTVERRLAGGDRGFGGRYEGAL